MTSLCQGILAVGRGVAGSGDKALGTRLILAKLVNYVNQTLHSHVIQQKHVVRHAVCHSRVRKFHMALSLKLSESKRFENKRSSTKQVTCRRLLIHGSEMAGRRDGLAKIAWDHRDESERGVTWNITTKWREIKLWTRPRQLKKGMDWVTSQQV